MMKKFIHNIELVFIFNIILRVVSFANSTTTTHRLFPLETPLARAGVALNNGKHNSYLRYSEGPPAKLSINEGEGIDVGLNTDGLVTLNLNRAVSQEIKILVSIYSGPELIEFGKKNSEVRSMPNSSIGATSIVVTYEADRFGDKVVDFHTKSLAGHAEIVCKVQNQTSNSNVFIDDSEAYISINIHRSWNLTILIHIVGWIYFLAWSISFYFQIILNYKRKSVIGLNFDFIAMNLLGFACYTIYNFTLLFSRPVQQIYYQRYTYTRIPVEYNDLFFSLHAFLVSVVTMIQCFIYERGDQKVSIPTAVFLGIASVLGLGSYIASLFNSLTILDVVLYLSYVKLAITAIKYTPQAFMNYQRKATTGWSIHNILLDFTGGTFSLAQMFFIAYNYNDWISIFGNFTKFGLAIISISFDILFMVQHYILYKRADGLEDSAERLNPVISESIRSASYAPQQQQPPTPGSRNNGRFVPHNDNNQEADFENHDEPIE